MEKAQIYFSENNKLMKRIASFLFEMREKKYGKATFTVTFKNGMPVSLNCVEDQQMNSDEF